MTEGSCKAVFEKKSVWDKLQNLVFFRSFDQKCKNNICIWKEKEKLLFKSALTFFLRGSEKKL